MTDSRATDRRRHSSLGGEARDANQYDPSRENHLFASLTVRTGLSAKTHSAVPKGAPQPCGADTRSPCGCGYEARLSSAPDVRELPHESMSREQRDKPINNYSCMLGAALPPKSSSGVLCFATPIEQRLLGTPGVALFARNNERINYGTKHPEPGV